MSNEHVIAIDMITPEFLMKMDDLNRVWLSWSWLSMIGYERDPEKYALYERIYQVKEQMYDAGYRFKADGFEGENK